MSSRNYPVTDRGIYHSLPTFSPDIKDLHAIVTGANGISGFGTLRVLLESPHRWSKVYTMSRKPPPQEMMELLSSDERSRVQHVAVDFLSSADEIAKAMTSAGVTNVSHIFFYSYLQPPPENGAPAWSNAQELSDVNSKLLRNFLSALPTAGIQPQRVLLQTGAKNYGIHIGRTRSPCVESDPQPAHLAPNFYYSQEEALFAYCKEHGVGWNVIMPAWIIGATNSAQINGILPFAVYAVVQARKGEPLQFPGPFDAWQDSRFHSTAKLTGYLSEWAVLEEACKNQRFNAQDTAAVTWERVYDELVRWYGVGKGIAPPEEDDGKFGMIIGRAGKETPLGYGPPQVMKFSFSFIEWASKEENKKAWKEIMDESGGKLTFDPFEDPKENFEMADAACLLGNLMSMTKARRMGWTGFVDTMESIFEMFKENAALGVLPPMKVEAANPLV